MATEIPEGITGILREISAGDEGAWNELLPRVYGKLRDISEKCFRGVRGDLTLEPTALVHEAWVRLAGQKTAKWNDRTHFLAMAARVMRGMLIDQARRRAAQKRGGDWQRITLTNAFVKSDDGTVDILDLDSGLRELAELSPRQARVVELRFFGGLTVEEIAEFVSVSVTTVETEWRLARAWLSVRLQGDRRGS